MNFVGGDYKEFTYTHPTLGSGTFYPVSGESFTIDPGGYRSDDEANGLTGDRQVIDIMKAVRWSVEGPCAWAIGGAVKGLEELAALAASPLAADWTGTHISGAIHGGKGKPVGDIQGDSGAATFTLKISGGGDWKPL